MADSTAAPAVNGTTLGGFMRLLAHELGNPVATIRMSAEMLVGGTPGELQSQLFEIILSESGRLVTLIESAVYYTSIPSTEPLEIDLDSLLHSVVHQAGTSVPVTVENNSGVTRIRGDAPQLSRMLREVLLNTIDAGATWVKVSVAERGDMVVFSVADDGEGIQQAKWEGVFEPFYTTREGQLGLGLSIARRIAELHGGTVAVAATAPPATVIEIEIPARVEENRI
jgi:two-component system sensor histidine kinase AtoS